MLVFSSVILSNRSFIFSTSEMVCPCFKGSTKLSQLKLISTPDHSFTLTYSGSVFSIIFDMNFPVLMPFKYCRSKSFSPDASIVKDLLANCMCGDNKAPYTSLIFVMNEKNKVSE